MIPLTLAEVAGAVGGTLHDAPDPGARVTGDVELDSRRIRPGGLFVALAGERVDGHEHAAGAVAAGAVGVLGGPAGRACPRCVVRDLRRRWPRWPGPCWTGCRRSRSSA